MKISSIKQWNRKQRKLNSKKATKQRRKQGLCGKVAILIGTKNKNVAALLRFTTKYNCRTLGAVVVNEGIIKQTNRRFVITPRRKRKVLRQVEVIVTEKFRDEFVALHTCKTELLEVKIKPKEESKKTAATIIESSNHQSTSVVSKKQDCRLLDGSSINVKTTSLSHEPSKTQTPAKVKSPLKKASTATITVTQDQSLKKKLDGPHESLTRLLQDLRKPAILDESKPDSLSSNPARSKDSFQLLQKTPPTQVQQTKKKITPIKIYNCSICNHKFTHKGHYMKHMVVHDVDLEGEDSSEGELMIDDDVELVLDDESVGGVTLTHHQTMKRNNLKKEPDQDLPSLFYCSVVPCTKLFHSEEELVLHVAKDHQSVEERPFKCDKCNERFKRESGMIAHQRMVHPVQIIEALPGPPQKGRRKSTHTKLLSSNGNSPETSSSANSRKSSQDSIPQTKTIRFERFDSAKKKLFVCALCSASFVQRMILDRHMRVFHIPKSYKCFKCDIPYSRTNLLSHIQTAHASLSNDERYIKTILDVDTMALNRCPFCIFTSKSKPLVEEHMINEHYEKFEKSDQPDEEDHVSSSPDSLENLLLPESYAVLEQDDEEQLLIELPDIKRTRKSVNDPSFKFRCARCLRRFSTGQILRKHECMWKDVITTSPMTPIASTTTTPTAKSQMINGFFNCLSCPQIFTDRNMFQSHVSSAHPNYLNNVGFYKDNNN